MVHTGPFAIFFTLIGVLFVLSQLSVTLVGHTDLGHMDHTDLFYPAAHREHVMYSIRRVSHCYQISIHSLAPLEELHLVDSLCVNERICTYRSSI